jgi:hypothetical protein
MKKRGRQKGNFCKKFKKGYEAVRISIIDLVYKSFVGYTKKVILPWQSAVTFFWPLLGTPARSNEWTLAVTGFLAANVWSVRLAHGQ